MTMNKVGWLCVAAVALLRLCTGARAALPPDFPQLSILQNTNPAPGYLFGSLSVSNVPGYSNYFAILDNDGSPILLNKTNSLGELARAQGDHERATPMYERSLAVHRELGRKGSVAVVSESEPMPPVPGPSSPSKR